MKLVGRLADAACNFPLPIQEVGGPTSPRDLSIGRIPMGRDQTPADIGAAALYLATADNVSGIALPVAGGLA